MSSRGSLWIIYAASALVLSGIQAVLPILPSIQQEFGLTDAQVSLLITVYVLPSALFAIPVMTLADRVGRRPILVWALAVFGLGGAFLLFRHSFTELLVVRAVQGLCFAPVIPLCITIIGDHLSGPDQVSTQARRVVAMNIGNVLIPAISGVVAVVAWYGPFAIQALTLPLAVLARRRLPDDHPESATPGRATETLRAAVQRHLLPLHATAFARFFLRYALLTALPLLLAGRFGASPTTIGVILAGVAVAGSAGAVSATLLATRIHLIALLGFGFLGIGIGLLGASAPFILGPVVVATLIYGWSDGVFGVVHVSLLTGAVAHAERASMVGVAGGMKNLGQMIGPSAVGVSLLVVPLGVTLATLGLLSIAATSLARFVVAPGDLRRSVAGPTR